MRFAPTYIQWNTLISSWCGISNKVHPHLPASKEAEARARLCVADNVLVEKMKRKQRKRSRKILVLEAMKVRWHALLCFATFFIMHKCCSFLFFSTISFRRSFWLSVSNFIIFSCVSSRIQVVQGNLCALGYFRIVDLVISNGVITWEIV